MNSTTCRSCGRAIFYVISPDGANMPVDLKPVTVYTLDVSTDPPRALRATALNEKGQGFVSHFATCPNAASHSRGRRP